ncbi:6570_t:CDS:10 [Ambispora gerdemannii]|uniref:6570_t:CDS:1 n=1 Tax=Ambispora gerdemannii TaxID=144530 RepID=A0A9N9APW1_9GLOM|nr:6570_t:CDS:10 [Ambispora gerdemannii]
MQSSNEKTRDTFEDSSAVIPSNTEASNENKYNLPKDASTNITSQEATTEKRPNDLDVTIVSNAITKSSSSNGKGSYLSKYSSIAYTVTKATKVGREASAAFVSNTNTQSISNQIETPAEVSLDTDTDTPATEKEADFQKSSVTGKIDVNIPNINKSDLPEKLAATVLNLEIRESSNETKSLEDPTVVIAQDTEISNENDLESPENLTFGLVDSINEPGPDFSEDSSVDEASNSNVKTLLNKPHLLDNQSLISKEEIDSHEDWFIENTSDIELHETRALLSVKKEPEFTQEPSTAKESDIEMDELLIEKETNFLKTQSEDSTSISLSQINALIADSDRVEMNTANFIPISPSQDERFVESRSAEISTELNNEQESDPVVGKSEISVSDTRSCIDRSSNFSTHPNSPNLHNIPYSTLLMDSPVDILRNSSSFSHSESPILINLKTFLDIIPSMESKYNQQLSSTTSETFNTQIESPKASDSVEDNGISSHKSPNDTILRNIAHKYFPPERNLSESLSICQQSANLFEFRSCIRESNSIILAENDATKPSRVSIEQKDRAKPSRWLYVSNVPKNTDRRALINLLWAQGDVNNVLVGLLDSEGLVYIIYYDIIDAMKARKVLQGYLLGDSYLKAEFCSKPFSKKATDLDDLAQWEWDNDGIILLNVLGRRLEEPRIKCEFSIYGNILSVKPLTSENSERMLIEYYDTRDANDAKKIANNKLLRNATLKVEYYNHEVYSWRAINKLSSEETYDTSSCETSPDCGPNATRQTKVRQNNSINNNSIIASGNREDGRTTFMIRNIPNKYTQRMLLETLDATHKGQYDFIYLRIDFKNRCNVGYAFINFVDTNAVLSFIENRVEQARIDRKIPKQQRDEGDAGIPAKNLLLLWELEWGGTTIPSFPMIS